MKDIKKKLYVISILLFLTLSLICSLFVSSPTITNLSQKELLNSFYIKNGIDYIIPSPSRQQVENLIIDDESFISNVVPYYSLTSGVKVNGKNTDSATFLFETVEFINDSPYKSERVQSGKKDYRNGAAVVDNTFKNTYSCNLGEAVTFSYKGQQYDFEIISIVETNPMYKNSKGSVALVLEEEIVSLFNDDDIKYSAAYVKSSNTEKTDEYLSNKYKPLGKLKDRDSFDTDEAYNLHVSKFYSYQWSKEITFFEANYEAEILKLGDVQKNSSFVVIAESITIIVTFIIFYCLFFSIESNSKKLDIVIRKNRSYKNIISMIGWNLLFVVSIFSVTYTLSLVFSAYFEVSLIGLLMIIMFIAPVVSAVIGAVLSSIILKSKLRKKYE